MTDEAAQAHWQAAVEGIQSALDLAHLFVEVAQDQNDQGAEQQARADLYVLQRYQNLERQLAGG